MKNSSCNFYLDENFTLVCEESSFRFEKQVKDKTTNGYFITWFNQMKPFKRMKLTKEAVQIRNTPNAGGSSVESETLSCEMFRKCWNARLLKTEMEVAYFPEGGSITDYVVYLFDQVIGISVTRAMKFNGEAFTLADADWLLRKKLKGIKQSSRNSLLKWDKQILHVWLFDENAVFALLTAWADLEAEVKTNTVMVLTVATNSSEVFANQEPKAKKKKKIIC
jgi:hypothetical protein